MFEELEKVREKCLKCTKCDLHKTRNNIVFGDGVVGSKIMLIGEAPGFNEDMQGVPFVGRAGKLLDDILGSVGLSRKENVYICNTVKCRPPENRNPEQVEKNACREYLDKQIEILKPKIILICGAVALNSMMGLNGGITKVRGKWFDGPNGSKMMPIFHPSYLLRNPSHKEGSPKWLMWQDIKEVRRYFDSL
ncbi:MAG: uracil-DNA glycosylase [Cyanobacteria bacterium SIG30]|nr:uracil-DNA glycosylase [Cyanobacteria bacterium SIG30]